MHLEHIGIVVDDLAAAKEFFTALGLEVEGETSVAGEPVDRINGLEGVQADVVILPEIMFDEVLVATALLLGRDVVMAAEDAGYALRGARELMRGDIVEQRIAELLVQFEIV